MNAPAVAVAIPAYSPTYIADAIDSVLKQTFQDFEIVLVNDGSPQTPELERVLEPFQTRIRYIRQENAGGAAARNTAIRAAVAPLIVNLDHDDQLLRRHLETQVAFMREHPEVDACYVNSTYFGGTALDGTHWMDHNPSNGEVSFLSVMAGRTCPANPGSIIRRDTLLRLGLYDPAVDSWDDFDMWLRILKSGGKMAYNKEPLVRYRVHGENVSLRRLYYMESGVRVLDRVEATMELTAGEREALAARRRAAEFDLTILRGKDALRRRDWSTAASHFETCFRERPSPKLRSVLFALRWCPWALGAALSVRGR